jgi:hypothetical protein
MTEVNSTAEPATRKPRKPDCPRKPHKDFPLPPSSNGKWCKKVLGKLRCFGSWRDDPKGARALERWLSGLLRRGLKRLRGVLANERVEES